MECLSSVSGTITVLLPTPRRIYLDVPPSQAASLLWKHNCRTFCVADVADWCGALRLQLNPAKTEVVWFSSITTVSADVRQQ